MRQQPDCGEQRAVSIPRSVSFSLYQHISGAKKAGAAMRRQIAATITTILKQVL